MSGKRFKVAFFLKQKSFYSKSFSDHMDCSFGNSVKFVLAVTPKDLAQSPKVWKVLFFLENCASENSAGHLEGIPDKIGVFLQIIVSSEKPWQYMKLIFIRKKFFSKCSSGHLKFGFHTLVENVCQHPDFLHSKSAYRVKKFFFWKIFCLKVFFWTHGKRFWQVC